MLQNAAALLAVAAAALTAFRVLAKLRQVTAQLDDCTRDRAKLRAQVDLVVRAVLGLVPAGDRRRMLESIQQIELEDKAA